MEDWKDVVGWEGLYQVSSYGNVKNARTGLILRQGINGKGRYTVRPYSNGCGRTKNVHCLVAEAFLGPKPRGLEVCHNDGNCLNNRIENLRYDTRSENIKDRYRHGWVHPNKAKTHCPQGHEYTAENTYVYPDGSRECRTCKRDNAKAQYAKGTL